MVVWWCGGVVWCARDQLYLREKRDAYNGIDMSAFLMNPIKRLSRYDALLRELQRSTPPEHAEAGTIEAALGRIRSIIDQLTEARRAVDTTNSLAALNASMQSESDASGGGSLLQPERKLVRTYSASDRSSPASIGLSVWCDVM